MTTKPAASFTSAIVLIASSVMFFAVVPLRAQDAPGPRDRAPPRSDGAQPAVAVPAKPIVPPAAQLTDLFGKLAAAPDPTIAGGLVRQIERLWNRSGSDTADLLMSRAVTAIQQKEQELAIEILDRIVSLEPDWAEGWNRRATLFFMMGDYSRSMADIRQVLAREPRHFAAIAGMGAILEQFGDKKRAMEAYRRAVGLHPHLEAPKKAIDRLAPEVDGRDI